MFDFTYFKKIDMHSHIGTWAFWQKDILSASLSCFTWGTVMVYM